MSAVNEIVDISISRETLGVRRSGFSIPIIIGDGLATGDRISFFQNREDVANAVFGGTDSTEYKMADVIFSQNPSVERIAIGGINPDKEVVFTGTMTQGTITATVNNVEVEAAFNTDLDTTISDLATAIGAAGIDAVSSATSSTNTLSIVANTGYFIGVLIDFSGLATNDTVTAALGTGTESVLEAFREIRIVNDSWYWVLITSRDEQDHKDIALEVEGLKKHFVTATSDTNVINQAKGTDTTSIAAFFQDQAYVRTSLFYITDNTAQFPDAGYVGRLAPLDPGSYTGKSKTLIKITRDDLTSTQSINARDKNCNTYEEIGNKNITREGVTPSGEFTDTIVFIDWLESTMADDVYRGLTSTDKTPFTDAGIQSVGASMEPSLKTGQNRGGISPTSFDDDDVQDGGYVINLPRRQDLDSNDIANRILRDVYFTAWLAGAVHFVKIRGTVTV